VATSPAGEVEEADGWWLYRNQQFRLELRVPQELEASEQLGGEGPGAPALRVRFTPRGGTPGPLAEREPAPFQLDVFANPDELSTEAWLDRAGWPFARSIRQLAEVETGAGTALEVSSSTQQAPGRFLYLVNGPWLVRLTPLGGASQGMIASLRFLD
jgi:hypothetical protein